ncbi:hypothetical protein CHS0354_039583, partial [Potamilus streckersoni]
MENLFVSSLEEGQDLHGIRGQAKCKSRKPKRCIPRSKSHSSEGSSLKSRLSLTISDIDRPLITG